MTVATPLVGVGRVGVRRVGGHPQQWSHTREFNLQQDVHAARVLFNSGVPLVHLPCINVAEHLRTTPAELAQFVKRRGAIGDYLFEMYSDYYDKPYARSKELWDVGAVAWLINSGWMDSVVTHSPILNDNLTWSHDPHRHLIREIRAVKRDAIFGDLFRKLAGVA